MLVMSSSCMWSDARPLADYAANDGPWREVRRLVVDLEGEAVELALRLRGSPSAWTCKASGGADLGPTCEADETWYRGAGTYEVTFGVPGSPPALLELALDDEVDRLEIRISEPAPWNNNVRSARIVRGKVDRAVRVGAEQLPSDADLAFPWFSSRAPRFAILNGASRIIFPMQAPRWNHFDGEFERFVGGSWRSYRRRYGGPLMCGTGLEGVPIGVTPGGRETVRDVDRLGDDPTFVRGVYRYFVSFRDAADFDDDRVIDDVFIAEALVELPSDFADELPPER